MVNWKSPEAKDRLLAAVVAAKEEKKLVCVSLPSHPHPLLPLLSLYHSLISFINFLSIHRFISSIPHFAPTLTTSEYIFITLCHALITLFPPYQMLLISTTNSILARLPQNSDLLWSGDHLRLHRGSISKDQVGGENSTRRCRIRPHGCRATSWGQKRAEAD